MGPGSVLILDTTWGRVRCGGTAPGCILNSAKNSAMELLMRPEGA